MKASRGGRRDMLTWALERYRRALLGIVRATSIRHRHRCAKQAAEFAAIIRDDARERGAR